MKRRNEPLAFWMFFRIGAFFCVGFLLSTTTHSGMASEKPLASEEGVVIKTRSVRGEIDMIRPMYMSVNYTMADDPAAAYAMQFPLHEDLKIYRAKKLDDLKPGTRVEVTYVEKIWLNEKGEEERSERKATGIKFLGPPRPDRLSSTEGNES